MAGEDAAYCKILAANGAVLPLARLLLNTTCYNQGRAAENESAATTAAWALSNMLWGDPSQVDPCLPQGFVIILAWAGSMKAIYESAAETHQP